MRDVSQSLSTPTCRGRQLASPPGSSFLAEKIELLPIAHLKPREKNPRTHTKKQIRMLADSIAKFGFTNPVIIDGGGKIVAGHGRLAAAVLLEMTEVPAIRLKGLTPDELRAYVLADNRLAELAGWDRDLLAVEFQYLSSVELDFDLSLIGFDVQEIEEILNGQFGIAADPAVDALPDVSHSAPPICKKGDLWKLGRHRLLCADATRPESYQELLGTKRAQLVFTDPPYNVPIAGNVSGRGGTKHSEFVMGSGEMSDSQFESFLTSVCKNLADFSADGSIHFICMDWRHIAPLLAAGRRAYSELKNLCVWNKTNAGMGTFYRSKHELVFVFKNGRRPHINTFMLGQHGRHRTNVWDYAGQNSPTPERSEQLSMHPTVKPVALVADAIKDCSRRSGTVLDAFGGSGTTIIAAEVTGRCAYTLELDPHYCDIAILRWQKLTGESAVNLANGASFNVRNSGMGRTGGGE